MKTSIKNLSYLLLFTVSTTVMAENRAIMMEKLDDPLTGMGDIGERKVEAMRKVLGDSVIAISYRHCIQIKTGSLEEEFIAREGEMEEDGDDSETKTIALIDQCPQPANAQCANNSGERIDFYYTESSRVLESLEGGCEIKMNVLKGVDPSIIGEEMEEVMELAQRAGGKWTTTVENQAMSDFMSTTTEAIEPVKTEAELAKEAQERAQASQDAMGLAFFGNRIKDKPSILELLKEEPGAFRILDDKFKVDKDIVLAAVTRNGRVLKLVGDSFKNDKEVVLAAVKSRAKAYQYADESLKDSKEFALEAIMQNPGVIHHIPEKYRENKDIQAAVKASKAKAR